MGKGTALDGVLKEISVMKTLCHPNCVQLFEVIDDRNPNPNPNPNPSPTPNPNQLNVVIPPGLPPPGTAMQKATHPNPYPEPEPLSRARNPSPSPSPGRDPCA